MSNNYLLGDKQYPNNREVLLSLLNKWRGSKKQQPKTTTKTTIQEEVEFVQKYTDRDDKNGKRVNEAGQEQCQHCGNKDGPCIDECPDLSPAKRKNIKKDGT